VEDEEEEAAHSHEIQEGRLENTARQEVSRAVDHMSRAEAALAAVDTKSALQQARLAVGALQRAFGRNRYLLRTLPVRSRVDPSRRLSGELDGAGDWRRAQSDAAADERERRTRDLFARALAIAPALGSAAADGEIPGILTRAAEDALVIAPGEQQTHEISRTLLELRDAVIAGRPAGVRYRLLGEAVAPLSDALRARAIEMNAAPNPPAGALAGSWADEMRRR
jgi:hypothetical protein